MSETIYRDIVLTTMECGSCGIAFAMPESKRAECERNGGSWYCPNGHSRVYKETFKQKYEREQQRRQEAERRTRATRDLLAAEERSHNATKGHLTRTKKRASAGVCPCCNRTFQQLARHMKAKHPGFVKESA